MSLSFQQDKGWRGCLPSLHGEFDLQGKWRKAKKPMPPASAIDWRPARGMIRLAFHWYVLKGQMQSFRLESCVSPKLEVSCILSAFCNKDNTCKLLCTFYFTLQPVCVIVSETSDLSSFVFYPWPQVDTTSSPNISLHESVASRAPRFFLNPLLKIKAGGIGY